MTHTPAPTYTDIITSARYHDLCAALRRYHDGTGDLGIIVAQALADNPAATADDIAAIIEEARADAIAEIGGK